VATKWQRSHRAKPTLDDVLANVTPGRSHRLHLNPEQKRTLADRDGRLIRQVIRALLRARQHAVALRQPRDEFPLTEHACQAIARKLGHTIGQKRARGLIHRALEAGIIRDAGSYRQTYRITGPSGYRVKLFEIGVRITARSDELATALRLEPLSAKRGLSSRQAGVPWYEHPLFGASDGLPPPGLNRRQRRRMRRWRERRVS
jgi:hypothetical protein